MDKTEKISPFILDTDGQWKLRHNPKVTKPIIRITMKENPGKINGDYSYTLYDGDVSIGSLCRTSHARWSLRLDCGISLKGKYRYDLKEEAEVKYANRI